MPLPVPPRFTASTTAENIDFCYRNQIKNIEEFDTQFFGAPLVHFWSTFLVPRTGHAGCADHMAVNPHSDRLGASKVKTKVFHGSCWRRVGVRSRGGVFARSVWRAGWPPSQTGRVGDAGRKSSNSHAKWIRISKAKRRFFVCRPSASVKVRLWRVASRADRLA